MADLQQNYRQNQQHPTQVTQSQSKAPSSSQVIALVTIIPVGAILLILGGLTLAGTLIGLAVTAPLFVIFSPVLIPAALLIALAVTAFLTSGAFGITAVSSFAWLANYVRRSRIPDQLEHLKRRSEETAEHAAQRVKEAAQEAGQTIQNTDQESAQAVKTKAQEEGNTSTT
ncbi:hypothetical protein L6164_011034 [Bauhinia variegata]|uniref:Uncharacterized protein n=1 Tax=Bauhinia variegata TaxID=167791 RepID=A0ACB9P4R3_BAUVA|nr:hypothetical protein L6164_011034 [Bauhinia variegata]